MDMEKYKPLTLGSLFDGSGTFPLGGLISGITPLWSSEIEPFPVRVTTKRFPWMMHYGDISTLSGAELPPVDIITFGSPCQDMSVAGKRSGLDGSRSSLFYEAIRIIKEMRGATNGRYPTFAVWENVPGAFSSNKGQDFRCVLEEFCKIKEPGVSIPFPGKWESAGCILGDGYSVAWREFNAAHWGVPQRRKRIYLIADFAGGSAGKILFESEGLSGYTPQGFRAWEKAAGNAAEGSGTAGKICLNDQGGNRMDVTNDVTCTLRAESHHPPCVLEDSIPVENHGTDGRVKVCKDGMVQTLTSRMGTGGNNVPLVMEKGQELGSCNWDGGQTSPTLTSSNAGGNQRMPDKGNMNCVVQQKAFGICAKDSNCMKSSNPDSGFYEADTSKTLDAKGGDPACNQGGIAVVAIEGNGSRPSHHGDGYRESDVMYTLNGTEQHGVAYGIDRAAFNQGRNAKFDFSVTEEVEQTLVARGPNAVGQPRFSSSKASFFTQTADEKAFTLVATDYKDPPIVNDVPPKAEDGCEYIVRRLTPTECARLQGFPDWWCDGLETENPTEEDIKFWSDVWETHRKVVGTSSKPKTEAQIIKWLKNPNSDAAEYKMWGNGCALPNVYFVLEGIKWAYENRKGE